MKIAYILPSLRNQGPIIVVKSLSDYLVQHGCEVDVYYFDNLPGLRFNCATRHLEMNELIDFDNYDIILTVVSDINIIFCCQGYSHGTGVDFNLGSTR